MDLTGSYFFESARFLLYFSDMQRKLLLLLTILCAIITSTQAAPTDSVTMGTRPLVRYLLDSAGDFSLFSPLPVVACGDGYWKPNGQWIFKEGSSLLVTIERTGRLYRVLHSADSFDVERLDSTPY